MFYWENVDSIRITILNKHGLLEKIICTIIIRLAKQIYWFTRPSCNCICNNYTVYYCTSENWNFILFNFYNVYKIYITFYIWFIWHRAIIPSGSPRINSIFKIISTVSKIIGCLPKKTFCVSRGIYSGHIYAIVRRNRNCSGHLMDTTVYTFLQFIILK